MKLTVTIDKNTLVSFFNITLVDRAGIASNFGPGNFAGSTSCIVPNLNVNPGDPLPAALVVHGALAGNARPGMSATITPDGGAALSPVLQAIVKPGTSIATDNETYQL